MRAKAAIRLSFFCFHHLCAAEALAEAQAESGGGRHTHFYSHTRSKKEIFCKRQHCSHFFFVLRSFSEGGSLSSARVWPKAIEEAQALLNHRPHAAEALAEAQTLVKVKAEEDFTLILTFTLTLKRTFLKASTLHLFYAALRYFITTIFCTIKSPELE